MSISRESLGLESRALCFDILSAIFLDGYRCSYLHAFSVGIETVIPADRSWWCSSFIVQPWFCAMS